MTGQRTIFVCQKCGAQSPKWIGRCPECGEWNSMAETVLEVRAGEQKSRRKAVKPLRLSEIKKRKLERIKTGILEFDRVLGGGIVPGSVFF